MAPNNSLELRRRVGIGLRAVPVLILAYFWIGFLWWWIALGSWLIAVALTLLHPLAYIALRPINYLVLAFMNSKDPVLPNYWDGYPDKYFEWCPKATKLGFPTLLRFLMVGFDDHSPRR